MDNYSENPNDIIGLNELVYSNDSKGVIDLFSLLENSEY